MEDPIDLIDPARYPHACPTGKAPAYIGAIRHIAWVLDEEAGRLDREQQLKEYRYVRHGHK